MTYYTAKTLDCSFDDGVARATEALKGEGFGVLTEIDVRETLKKKIGVEFRSYKILGACNPALAHEALLAEDKIGLMLPCNVVVQDIGGGRTEIAVIDPAASMATVPNPHLAGLAERVRAKLRRVVEAL